MAKRPTRDRTVPEDAPADSVFPTAVSEGGDVAPQLPPVEERSAGLVPEDFPANEGDAPPAAEVVTGSPDDPAQRQPAVEPEAPPPPSPGIDPRSAEPPRRGGGGFAGLVLGGALAAAAGAGAAIYLGPDYFQRTGPSAQEVALLGSVRTQGDNLSALQKAVDQLAADAAQAAAAPKPDLSALDTLASRLDPVAAAQADIAKRLDAAEARLADLESRPAAAVGTPGVSGADLAEVKKLLETQRAEAEAARAKLAAAAADAETRIKAAEAEANRLKAESEAAAKLARSRAVVSHLQAALQTGAPIQPALDELTALGVAIPPALADQAGGVPSLDTLMSAFPPAAREALALSLRETAGTGTFDRVLAFLRVESGARSLSPRSGEDPDAVLSRAEAALGAGDLPAAIAEIAALPPTGQARMAEWVALAQRRVAAGEAVKTLVPAEQGG